MQEAASLIGVEAPRYRSWEQFIGPLPVATMLPRIAQTLAVNLDWLSSGQGEMQSSTQGSPLPFGAQQAGITPILSDEARTQLGVRMMERRVGLGLSRNEISVKTGVSHSVITQMEKQIPRFIAHKEREAIEDALFAPRGWLSSLEVEAPPVHSAENKMAIEAPSAKTCAEEILAVASWLTRERIYERTVDFNQLSEPEARNALVFACRYGYFGEDNVTLESVGARYGMTRERSRQIINKMLLRASEMTFTAPMLDQVIARIPELLPAKVSEIDITLRHLLGAPLSLMSLDRFGREVLQRPVASITSKPADMQTGWDPVVINPEEHSADILRHIRDNARRMIRSCGAAHVFFVAGATGHSSGQAVSPEEVIRGIKLVNGFDWLDEDQGWFWFGEEDKGNRVVTAVKKMISVAERPLDIDDIHAGACRARRQNYDESRTQHFMVEMPIHVMRDLLKKISWLRCTQSDDFRPINQISQEEALSETERAIVRVTKEHNGAVSRKTLQSVLLDNEGFSAPTLNLTISNSPIVRRIDRGVWTIRGIPIPPDAFAEAAEKVGGENPNCKLESDAPDEKGFFHYKTTATSYMLRTSVWYLPKAVYSRMPLGEYCVEGSDMQCSVVHFPEHGSYKLNGFVSHLKKMGLKEETEILFSFNPQQKIIRISLIEQEASAENAIAA